MDGDNEDEDEGDNENGIMKMESIKEIQIECSNSDATHSTAGKIALRTKLSVNNLDLLITSFCLAELASEISKIKENNQANKTDSPNPENTNNLLGRLESYGEATNILGKIIGSDASVYIYLSMLLSLP